MIRIYDLVTRDEIHPGMWVRSHKDGRGLIMDQTYWKLPADDRGFYTDPWIFSGKCLVA